MKTGKLEVELSGVVKTHSCLTVIYFVATLMFMRFLVTLV